MPLEIRQRLLAPVIVPGTADVDLGQFAQNLLLFDTFVLSSGRLREFPAIVEAFGFDAVLELLRTESFEIRCHAQAFGFQDRSGRDRLPPLSYEFLSVKGADPPESNFDSSIQDLGDLGLSQKQVSELAKRLKERWIPLPHTSGDDALDKTLRDFALDTPAMRVAAASHVENVLKRDIRSSDIELTITHFGERSGALLRADTNLMSDHGFTPKEAHLIVQSALSAVSRVNSTFSKMKEHTAVTGVSPDEHVVMDANLAFLWNTQDPSHQFSQASRVLEVSGVPNLSAEANAGRVDLTKLLELRQSPECKKFREFVWKADQFTDEEIEDLVGGIRAKLAASLDSKPGKKIRFVATAALGAVADLFVPVAGGATVGALDSFLVDKLFPRSGVVTFLSNQYPSIFTK